MNNNMKNLLLTGLTFISLLSIISAQQTAGPLAESGTGESSTVYTIAVQGDIDKPLTVFIRRSAVRAQMASLAEKNDHPKGIALAMVYLEIELIEAYVDGQVTAVTSEDFEELRNASDLEIRRGKTI